MKTNPRRKRRRVSGSSVFRKARRNRRRNRRPAWLTTHRRPNSLFRAPRRRRNHRHRVSNPRRSVFSRARRKSHRRRNPANWKGLALQIPYGIAGGVLARSIPETFLSSMNNGWVGYGLNLGTGYLLSMLADKISGPPAADAVLIGTGMATVSRAIDDYFNVNLVQFANYQSLVSAGTPPAQAAAAAAAAPATTGTSGDMKYRLTSTGIGKRGGMRGWFSNVGFTVPTSSLMMDSNTASKIVRRPASATTASSAAALPAGASTGTGRYPFTSIPWRRSQQPFGGQQAFGR